MKEAPNNLYTSIYLTYFNLLMTLNVYNSLIMNRNILKYVFNRKQLNLYY